MNRKSRLNKNTKFVQLWIWHFRNKEAKNEREEREKNSSRETIIN